MKCSSMMLAASIAVTACAPANSAPKCNGKTLDGKWLTTGFWGLVERSNVEGQPFMIFGTDVTCDIRFSGRAAKASGLCRRGFNKPWFVTLDVSIRPDCSISGTGRMKIAADVTLATFGSNRQNISGWLDNTRDQLIMVLEQEIEGQTVSTGQMVAYRRP